MAGQGVVIHRSHRSMHQKSGSAEISDNPLVLTDLLSYRLQAVANAMARSASLRYRSEFDLSLGEWRAMALLAIRSPRALYELTKETGLDKGQMSRFVKSLVDRKLVNRVASSKGGRAIELSLTAKGEGLYQRVMDAAHERNEAFLACLSPEEKRILDIALVKLGAVSRSLIKAHRAASVRQSPAAIRSS